ncbi:MAG TPA: hypothetical protein VJ436_13875 [Anaerolineales bacterium]|nr:hypothetical protein [Anaerolineales bacterium]
MTQLSSMQTDAESTPDQPEPVEAGGQTVPERKTRKRRRWTPILLLVVYILGLGSGFLVWGRQVDGAAHHAEDMLELANQVNPSDGYTLPARYVDLGPQLLAAGAIDYELFAKVYQQAGKPLTEAQLAILKDGSAESITIDQDNAYFLLNFFWAIGLVNQNPILLEGPMIQAGRDQVGRFASTGGWTIGRARATELYASTPIVTLTAAQQDLLEEVAANVYRPCCDNPTHFPDCNHGMAMLGLLQLLASQGATSEELYTAAKYVNAFWYPGQSMELAIFFKASQGQSFAEANSRQVVSRPYSSGSGFQAVHQWLASKGLLEPTPNGGNGCGV